VEVYGWLLLLLGFVDREEEWVLARSTAVLQVPGDEFICPHKETTAGTTAETASPQGQSYGSPLLFGSSQKAKEVN
jgi:hypothetical protein